MTIYAEDLAKTIKTAALAAATDLKGTDALAPEVAGAMIGTLARALAELEQRVVDLEQKQ